jgi:hypothetical protein
MKVFSILLVLLTILCCGGVKSPEKSSPTITKLTDAQAENALKSLKKTDDGRYRARIEFDREIWYIYIEPKLLDKFKSELKQRTIVTAPKLSIPSSPSSSRGSTSSKGGGLSFGPGGMGENMGNGFQRNLKDGSYGPSWD